MFDAQNNVMGTLNLLDAARKGDIKRFIYFSSAAVYGNPISPIINEMHPREPVSPYGLSKLSGEKYALLYNKIYNLPVAVIRPFNIYSPRQDPSNPYSGVISKFFDNIRRGKPPVIFGDGRVTRDFVSVHDVVDMVLLMLKNRAAVGKVFNCGTGVRTRIDELANMIISQCGNSIKPEFFPERPGDIKNSCADISLAADIIGYKPKVKLKEGLKEIVDS
jgi:UDP-glucose 4-epimerase